MDKILFVTMLYDFYSELLTQKQRDIFELYYLKDFSLSEISEEYSISRQAVQDLVKRTEKILNDYEQKLSLFSKYMKQKEALNKIISKINSINYNQDYTLKNQLNEIKSNITTLLD